MTKTFLPYLIAGSAVLALSACNEATDDAAERAENPTAEADVATAADGADPSGMADASAVSCTEGEQAVFQCSAGGKSAAICSEGGSLTLRYRDGDGAPVEITSTGQDGKAFLGGERGAAYQTTLRFVDGGTDYIAYFAEAGEKSDVPGKTWSGVAVQNGDQELGRIECGEAQDIPMTEPGGVDVENDPKELGFLF